MGVTSSGLLDEERDNTDASMSARESDSPDNTLTDSGEKHLESSAILGRDAAGTPHVQARGPCIYYLP